MSFYFDWQGNPIDRETWWRLFEDERHVALDTIEGVEVSTVYSGLDLGFGRAERPLIFETMVFGGPLDSQAWRWATDRDAREGHAAVLALVAEAEQSHQPRSI